MYCNIVSSLMGAIAPFDAFILYVYTCVRVCTHTHTHTHAHTVYEVINDV